ncbi:MAG: flippase-like domain-containing protein [Lachnospiraceae bacterium]|nr:flippase-like domain-containing protein [Lachnospiraceae bacterium]
MNKKKNLLWSLTTLVIAVISISAVISQAHHFSLGNFYAYVSNSNPVYLAVAVLLMFCYIFLEGHALRILLKAFGYKKRRRSCTVYSAADIYFSSVTPSATGGQPASAFFMVKDGIPAAIVTLVLLVNLILYTFAIMIVGLLALLIRPSIFIHFNMFSKILIIVGYLILALLAVGLILLIRYEVILQKICSKLILVLHRLHLMRRLNYWQEKLDRIIADYKKSAGMLQGHKKELADAFLANLFQRISLIGVPAAVVLAMERSLDNALSVWVTQVFVTIGATCVPIPGAQGVSDYLLLDGLGVMMGNDVAINLDLLSRSISFYGCVLISLIIIVIAYLMREKKKKKAFEREGTK